MKKRYWSYTAALVAVVFLVEYDVARRMDSKNRMAFAPKAPIAAPVVSAAALPKPAASADEVSLFDSRFLKEAQKISELSNDPKQVDQKMDQLALSMSQLDLKKLSIVMENQNENGDTRALAVELISRAKTRDAVAALKEFVIHQESGAGRNREFESVLRAQAIEGVAAYPQKDLALSYLNAMADQVDESFLKDRIVRSEENLKGRAPTTEQQDDAALKQLVQ